MTDTTVTPDEWKSAMGYFPSGVTAVTSWDGDAPVGSTVSAFCSVSLEPPLLMVCLGLENPALAPIKKSGIFGVNILPADAADLAMRLATPMEGNRFEGFSYDHADGGAPRFKSTPVFIDCVVHQSHIAGDHEIVIGRGVRTQKLSDVAPMVYHQGQFLKTSS